MEALTVNQANGDVYAIQGIAGSLQGKVARFDSTGAPKTFSATGTNTITGFTFRTTSAAEVAVDSAASSPLKGDIYVASRLGANAGVTIWDQNGNKLGRLTGAGTFFGAFGEACGVSVDQSNGSVLIADRFGGIWKYTPNSPTGELTDADYSVTGITTSGLTPCITATDSNGHVYAAQSNNVAKRFSISSFATGSPPVQSGTELDTPTTAMSADPVTNEVYIDEGPQIAVFDQEGNRVQTISGSGAFSGSRGVAISEAAGPTKGHVYVSAQAAGTISEFGFLIPPYVPINNPAILHAEKQAGTHSYADFQASRDGHYAAFASVMSLTGADTLGHYVIYRYDAKKKKPIAPRARRPWHRSKFDYELSSYGLNLASDGRVFFTSREGLVLSDTNEKNDAYEWEGGPSRPDLDRAQPRRLGAPLGERRRHGRLLLHSRHPRPDRRKRRRGEDL